MCEHFGTSSPDGHDTSTVKQYRIAPLQRPVYGNQGDAFHAIGHPPVACVPHEVSTTIMNDHYCKWHGRQKVSGPVATTPLMITLEDRPLRQQTVHENGGILGLNLNHHTNTQFVHRSWFHR